MAATLSAGVARVTITPPLGGPLCGTLRESYSGAVERDLTATALVLASGETRLALLACDLTRVRPTDAARYREQIGAVLGIPAAHVLLNVSHTHAAPDPPAWQEYDGDPAIEEATERYWTAFPEHLVEVARAADAARQPVRVGFGAGQACIGVNRREQLPDGTMVLGENPHGVLDPTVGVARFDGEDGRPVAVLFSHACHPDVLGPKCDLISPDYVGAARDTLEAIAGAPAVFLQGTAGDIDPRCGIVLGADGVEEMQRLGGELGAEAGRVFHGIATRRQRDHRVAWRSVTSVVTAWAYADIPAGEVPLAVASRTVRLPLRPLPEVPPAEAFLADARRTLDDVLAQGAGLPDRLVARRRVNWAELQLEAARRGGPTALDVELQAIRVGDLVILAIPGEVFVEIGLAIKARSAAPHTWVLGYSNGIYFYIPTAAAFAQGGYEIESYRNYQQPTGPTPEWEERLVAVGSELVAEVWATPAARALAGAGA